MAGYAIAHLDGSMSSATPGPLPTCPPSPGHLGLRGHGVDRPHGGDVLINEHDGDDPTADQELFLVLQGHAVFEVDGDRVDAPTGTLVFAPPGARRRASAVEGDTTLLAIKGTPGEAYAATRLGTVGSTGPPVPGGEYAEVAAV